MSVPAVVVKRLDFQTGSVPASSEGVLAIIAPSPAGTLNKAFTYTRDSDVATDYGGGALSEQASYAIAQSGKPVLVLRSAASTAATYGAVTFTGTGTVVVTAGTTLPADDYPVTVTFPKGGTIGDAGLTYTYSLDGNVVSAAQPLASGVAPILLTIPSFNNGTSPGVSFSLAAGTIIAGDSFTCTTVRARMTDADLTTALEGLRQTNQPWEAVAIDEAIGDGTVALVDQWLQGLEATGKFRLVFINTPLKAAGVTEQDYLTAMTTLVTGSARSIRTSLWADGGNVTSTITGLTTERTAALIAAARTMAIDLGVEPAYVALGPLGGVVITDGDGNALHHDEMLSPGLDDLCIGTLRTVPGQFGTFVTNGRIFSTVGSDYVLIPQARCMNAGLEVAFATLTAQLSRGVGKSPTNADGTVNLLDRDRRLLEGLVNTALFEPLHNQVAGYQFSVASDDNIGANSGAKISATLAISSLIYLKNFAVVSVFVRSFSI